MLRIKKILRNLSLLKADAHAGSAFVRINFKNWFARDLVVCHFGRWGGVSPLRRDFALPSHWPIRSCLTMH